jgi:hypothetical protein
MSFINGKNGAAQAVSGRSLAHRRRTAGERAAIAAQLVCGELHLIEPTISQAATLAGASVSYTRIALEAPAEQRAKLAAGSQPITDLLHSAQDRELDQAWATATSEARAAFGRRHVAELWDHAIAPSL